MRARVATAASEPPVRIREAASEVVTLATAMEREGTQALRGEACCARLLAGAAVAAAEAIIDINSRFAGCAT